MKTMRVTIVKLMVVALTLMAANAMAQGQNKIERKASDQNAKTQNGTPNETVLRIQTGLNQQNMLLCDNIDTPGVAINQTPLFMKYKSPTTAFLYSFLLPGGGQFYNGESKKGLIQLGIAVTGVLLAYSNWTEYEWVRDDYYWASYGYTREYGNETLMYTGIALYLGGAVWSMIDAPMSAKKINRQNGLTNESKSNAVPTLSLNDLHIDGKLTPGVSCTWDF